MGFIKDRIRPNSHVKMSQKVLCLMHREVRMPFCAEKARLCVEIAIIIKSHHAFINFTSNGFAASYWFHMAAQIYKELRMDGKAKGAYLSACREHIRYESYHILKNLREKHKKGLI